MKTSIYVCACSGDHTVKIIDCETGKCLKVLSGHRRTPWVVRPAFYTAWFYFIASTVHRWLMLCKLWTIRAGIILFHLLNSPAPHQQFAQVNKYKSFKKTPLYSCLFYSLMWPISNLESTRQHPTRLARWLGLGPKRSRFC